MSQELDTSPISSAMAASARCRQQLDARGQMIARYCSWGDRGLRIPVASLVAMVAAGMAVGEITAALHDAAH